MEISKIFQINGDYNDQITPVNWNMLRFAEVVFVDKTHSSGNPLLYQLNNPKLSINEIASLCKSNTLSFSQESFVYIGEVVCIDKMKKQILLTNNNTLAYHHLVIASGKKTILSLQDEELNAALQALTDALRVKPKIPTSFATGIKKTLTTSGDKSEPTFAARNKPEDSDSKENIEKIVHPYIVASETKLKSSSLDTFDSRFYEVQI